MAANGGDENGLNDLYNSPYGMGYENVLLFVSHKTGGVKHPAEMCGFKHVQPAKTAPF
jgi:hypothetical protein